MKAAWLIDCQIEKFVFNRSRNTERNYSERLLVKKAKLLLLTIKNNRDVAANGPLGGPGGPQPDIDEIIQRILPPHPPPPTVISEEEESRIMISVRSKGIAVCHDSQVQDFPRGIFPEVMD